jgi:hypothetical protein
MPLLVNRTSANRIGGNSCFEALIRDDRWLSRQSRFLKVHRPLDTKDTRSTHGQTNLTNVRRVAAVRQRCVVEEGYGFLAG